MTAATTPSAEDRPADEVMTDAEMLEAMLRTCEGENKALRQQVAELKMELQVERIHFGDIDSELTASRERLEVALRGPVEYLNRNGGLNYIGAESIFHRQMRKALAATAVEVKP